MSKTDQDIRHSILDLFDRILEDPIETEDSVRRRLIQIGVEPNLETMLSYTAGIVYGSAQVQSIYIYDEMRDEDIEGAFKLLEERAWILRETFLRTRYR